MECYEDEIITHLIADLSNAAIFCYSKKDKSSPEVFTDLERPLEIMSDSSLSNKNDIKIGTQSILTFTRSKSEQNTNIKQKVSVIIVYEMP